MSTRYGRQALRPSGEAGVPGILVGVDDDQDGGGGDDQCDDRDADHNKLLDNGCTYGGLS